MEYKTRTYPLFSACGLNCGLCPRYPTVGSSKCPGCSGEGFSAKHPPCGVLSCSQRKGIEYCFQCDEYPCKKYDGADCSDSFITHKNQFYDIEKAKKIGLEAYSAELNSKVKILEHLLQSYDDGRRKSFFCVAINLLNLQDVTSIMEQIKSDININAPQKEKTEIAVSLFEALAEKQSISLILRKKSKN